jgi:hypothetical protein
MEVQEECRVKDNEGSKTMLEKIKKKHAHTHIKKKKKLT